MPLVLARMVRAASSGRYAADAGWLPRSREHTNLHTGYRASRIIRTAFVTKATSKVSRIAHVHLIAGDVMHIEPRRESFGALDLRGPSRPWPRDGALWTGPPTPPPTWDARSALRLPAFHGCVPPCRHQAVGDHRPPAFWSLAMRVVAGHGHRQHSAHESHRELVELALVTSDHGAPQRDASAT